MVDIRIDKLADVLVNYSVSVKKGDKVKISGNSLAAPILEAIYKQVLQAGGHPLLNLTLPGMDEILFRHASDNQLQYIHETEKYLVENYDIDIALGSPANTKSLSSVNPEKISLHSSARKQLSNIRRDRAAAGTLRWVWALFPTQALAQDAEMSLTEYEEFVYNACLPDMKNPVAYWKNFQDWQQKIIDWFVGKKKISVLGPGTDLQMSIAGRTFSNGDGRMNMPDGEVFTGPVENSVEGHIQFSYPGIYKGNEVQGVRLWFEQGKVVKATAKKNENFLHKMLDSDEGARYVGEFAIATNKNITRFTKQILFDEKIGGTIHLALGAGYPETGSKNDSGIHWDMICDLRDEGEIWVDDELIFKNGQFVIEF